MIPHEAMKESDLRSTTRLLKEMSQTAEPGELLRLFFDYLRRSVDMERALVISSAGLSAPEFRLIHDVRCNDPGAAVVTMSEIHKGGLLADLLYLGEIQDTLEFVPNSSDPAFDFLQGSDTLMAFPLFEKGAGAGMVVLLRRWPHTHNPADVRVLAMMTSLLAQAIEAQKLANRLDITYRALDSELRAAAHVQRWLLPSLPLVDNIGIAASYRTARYSSGDYYDVGRLPDGKLGILVADVSGKGASAAVLMAVLRSIVHDEVDRTGLVSPAALLDYADTRLCALGLSERGTFVTAFCAVLDPVIGELIYSCAGHPPARLLRIRDRTVLSLSGATTLPLGLLNEPHRHTEEAAHLRPGDLALFYTDGIIESRSRTGEFFGVEHLDQILRDLPDPVSADAATKSIAEAVARFAGNQTPADDQTLLALGGLLAVT